MGLVRPPRTLRVIPLLVIALALHLISMGKAVPAAEQLDQENLPEWGGGWTHVNPGADSQAVMWQTFTPGCANLTAVEIDVLTISPGRGGDVLTVEIARDGVVLASAQCSVEDGFEGLLRFEFSEAVPLVPEQIHELKVRDTGTAQFGWKYGPNTYERGSRYVATQARPGTDWFFRTYASVEPAGAKYSGGTGTPDAPYQIATPADLIALGETPDDYDKHFILTADIDLDPNLPGRKVFERAVIAPDRDAVHGGFQGTPFTGAFDGSGHMISHLTIAGGGYLGLFGRTSPEAKVSNLGLEAVDVDGTGDPVGGLVAYNRGSIDTSYSTGTVSGIGSMWGGGGVGGLLGSNDGDIVASYSTATVNGTGDYVGGLTGVSQYASIAQSYSTGTVSGVSNVGGLVGFNYEGAISQSYSIGTVTGVNDVGGLVGTNSEASISQSCSNGTVRGADRVGGLVGQNLGLGEIDTCSSRGTVTGVNHVGGLAGENSDKGAILSSNSIITVTGNEGVGGLVGLNQASIARSCSSGTVTGAEKVGGLAGYNLGRIAASHIACTVSGDLDVGGLVGSNMGLITASYSTGTVNGLESVGGLVGDNPLRAAPPSRGGGGWYSGTAFACYSAAVVSGEQQTGGLVGSDPGGGFRDDCFWDIEMSHQTTSDGGIGKTTTEMQTATTFLDAGWDFVDETENGPNDVWKIVEGQTYPFLWWQKYGGGTGEPNDPYLIYTAEHLNALGAEPNDYDKHFKLMADIDLSGYEYDRAVIAPDVNDAEDWFQGAPFTGVFDGNGHTVSCLTIGGGGHIGLFGALGAEARVIDLGVEAVDVNGTGSYIGGLCGRNSGTISECHSAGIVTGGDASSSLGGLCGANGGTISRCKATASVAGGLYSSWLGGLCGVNSLGGGAISDCYAGGSVTSGDYSAALGGLCGDNWGTISRCYATAIVTSGDGSGALGGLCGGNFDTVSNCFWDRQTCGTSYSSGGWAMSTADMMTESTYIGWNNGVWVIDEGRDYPHLAWENTPGTIIDYEHPRSYPGNGEDQPFVLESPEDIVCLSLRSADWDKSFVLAGDIDMSSLTDYRPVGLFTGGFDGQGHIVQSLTIDADVLGNSNQLGLFGKVGSGGQVNDLRLLDATVTGPDHALYLGSLCGQNDGVISDCHASAAVSGGQSLGGLCGDNGTGIISNSYATGSVTGASYLGGLCGTNGGTVSGCYASVNVRREGAGYSPSLGGLVGSNFNAVSNSYATGSVTGASTSEDLAGLVGENSWGGAISNCYATGRVTGAMWALGGLCGKNWGDIAASFWDVESSGQATSAGGTGLTTAEMQTAATFLNAGWDFIDETENGTDDIWWILEGQDYPRLWWEAAGGGNSNF